MKVFILLLFVFTFPLVVLLSSILYGGFSKSIFKDELSKSGVYTQIDSYVQQLSFEEDDQMSAQFTDVLKNRFTADYIQTKTEETLDISTDWITGVSPTAPSVFFKEIKEDILSQYPQLLPELEQLANEAKQQAASDEWSGKEGQQTMDMMQGLDSISTLAKSDFSIELGTYLAPIKSTYVFLRIILPVLIILMVLYVGLLLWTTHPWSTRLTWIGATCMVSGIWGFIILFMNSYLVYLMTSTISANANDVLSIFSPVLFTLTNAFVQIYAQYLGMASIVALLIATGCFGAAAIINREPPKIKNTKNK